MKASEAKTKLCHFAIKADIGNTNYGESYGAYCICSNCMAWEYTETQEETEVITLFSSLDTQEDRSELTDRHIKVNEYVYGECFEKTETRYAIMEELNEDEKEGYCQRLVR